MKTSEKGLIAWFAENSVAANLLMVLIVVGGIASLLTMQKRTFPDFETDNVQVTVVYPGAAPAEVEEAICVKIEEAVEDVEGIERIRSRATEGSGRVTMEVAQSYDVAEVLNEIKLRVDAIASFPEQAEKPVIAKQIFRQQVLWLSVHGDVDERTLKAVSERVRDDLLALPEVSIAELVGDRDYEISIEVSEERLREYGLTLDGVAQAVRQASLDVPGGTIRSVGGDIRLRTKGQAYTGEEFERLVLRTNADGTRLLLGDVATIRDGFVETEGFSRFDGQPAHSIRVRSTSDQNDMVISQAVRDHIEAKRAELPAGIDVATWGDASYYLEGRLDMMRQNLIYGALLVFLTLTLFLRLRVAFWVMVGLPIAYLGALWLLPMPPFSTGINLLSLFGFILVLGVVVDDAIVIGESAYTETRANGHSLDNVIRGAKRVAVPATFGVLTTIAGFAPFLMIQGQVAPFFSSIAAVVVLCLVFSLVESKLILPAHLAHMRVGADDPDRPTRNPLTRLQRRVATGLRQVVRRRYQPLLERAMRSPGITLSLFAAVLILSVSLLTSGIVRMVMFPDVPSDFIQADLEMNDGTAGHVTRQGLDGMEAALREVDRRYRAEHDQPLVKHILVFASGDTSGAVVAELTKGESRAIDAYAIVDRWREEVGEIAGARELDFRGGTNAGGGAPLAFRLTGTDYDQLELAAEELQSELREYQGVFDIASSARSGSREIRLDIKPEAQAMGLSLADLGRQVRQAFYGAEAQRIQRGGHEIKVMVRYPRDERRSIGNLENMRVRTPQGEQIPLSAVAELKMDTGYATIERVDGRRAVTVSADIDPEQVEPQRVISDVRQTIIPELLSRYPGVSYGLEGASLEQQRLIAQLGKAALFAVFMIYALIAIPLRSYTQPLVIMSVIPFGLIGAVVGHMIVGVTMSMMSLFGLVALAGVVVNDSLIMVDFINRERAKGHDVITAAKQAGAQRFRAILLTSLTTFVGVLPIVLEQSLQAQFVIPMAVSLGFGILFATVITLFLIPTLYVLGARWSPRRRDAFGEATAASPA